MKLTKHTKMYEAQDVVWNLTKAINLGPGMRNSQQIIFWRDSKVKILVLKDKETFIFGKRFPKSAQEILEGVK